MTDYSLEDRGEGRFAVRGEMSFDTAQAILRASEDQFAGHASLEVDLTAVDDADSAALALLLEWKAQALQRSASIRFIGIPQGLLAVASTAEVSDLL